MCIRDRGYVDGNFPAFGKLFLVDASSTILGSLFGITTVSTFAESAAGVESGSRTGLSNLSTAFFFLLCMLFSPLFLMILSLIHIFSAQLRNTIRAQGSRQLTFALCRKTGGFTNG